MCGRTIVSVFPNSDDDNKKKNVGSFTTCPTFACHIHARVTVPSTESRLRLKSIKKLCISFVCTKADHTRK